MAWGDVTTTAFRLQTAAPVDGVLVDEATYRATRHTIDYGEAEPVQAKGKTQPILVWKALAPRARRGVDLSQVGHEPFVGRERGARSCFARASTGWAGADAGARHARRGAGYRQEPPGPRALPRGRAQPDSHLVASGRLVPLRRRAYVLGARGDRQGSSRASSRPTERPPLRTSSAPPFASLVPSPPRPPGSRPTYGRSSGSGPRSRLTATSTRPRSPPGGASSRQWRASTRSSSCSRTSTGRTTGSSTSSSTSSSGPATCRSSWSAPPARSSPAHDLAGGERAGARRELPTTIELGPLSRQETEQLVAELTGGGMRKGTKTAIVGAAAGNPLYAVEYVRMLEGRPGEEPRRPGDGAGHHRLAPRLALDRGTKRCSRTEPWSAESSGRGRWPRSVAGRRRAVERHLRELVRKEFLVRVRPSSVGGELEFRFRHALVRDVAYEQIPHARRGEIHRRTAEWLEALSPDRNERPGRDARAPLSGRLRAGESGERRHGRAERTRPPDAARGRRTSAVPQRLPGSPAVLPRGSRPLAGGGSRTAVAAPAPGAGELLREHRGRRRLVGRRAHAPGGRRSRVRRRGRHRSRRSRPSARRAARDRLRARSSRAGARRRPRALALEGGSARRARALPRSGRRARTGDRARGAGAGRRRGARARGAAGARARDDGDLARALRRSRRPRGSRSGASRSQSGSTRRSARCTAGCWPISRVASATSPRASSSRSGHVGMRSASGTPRTSVGSEPSASPSATGRDAGTKL